MIFSQHGAAFSVAHPHLARYLDKVASGQDVQLQDVGACVGSVFRDLSGIEAEGAAALLREIETSELAGVSILPQDDTL